MPEDEELPCLCIANGMAPAGHKRGERCPSWDILLFGNAYGRITEHYPNGSGRKVEWLDPKDVIVKWKEPVTVKPCNTSDPWYKRLIRYVLNPSRLVIGLPVAWVYAWVIGHHHVSEGVFWEMYGGWIIGTAFAFFVLEAYRWAGGERKTKR